MRGTLRAVIADQLSCFGHQVCHGQAHLAQHWHELRKKCREQMWCQWLRQLTSRRTCLRRWSG
eukprot:5420432-Amphidinium_carterae.2